MTTQPSNFLPVPMPTGLIEANGALWMMDGVGKLTAIESIPAQKKLRDELVRKEFGFALAISDQISRFRAHVINNLEGFDALMAQEYGVKVGGEKGNRTYTSYDGLWRIEVKVQPRIAFGPEMGAAKALFDECMREWSEDTPAELRSIVTNAFDVDREGAINRTNVHILLNVDSADERFQEGQRALRDAMYVISSKEYVRFSRRASHRDKWSGVTIDLASA
ncbi:MAG: sulfate transporter [Paracoccus denitrificans]|nr:MAG: sulfate transporter [Paracoccus denitrificans]PZO83644.1 MAG: sulfate transporter [Paracoccus denitrificans]